MEGMFWKKCQNDTLPETNSKFAPEKWIFWEDEDSGFGFRPMFSGSKKQKTKQSSIHSPKLTLHL